MRGMTAPSLEVLALLEATLDAVVIMDERGRIEAFNASAEEMFGYLSMLDVPCEKDCNRTTLVSSS